MSNEIHYTVNVGIWFHPGDLQLLNELAVDGRTPVADRIEFQRAAGAVQTGGMVIYQSMTPQKLAEFLAMFTNRGVRAPVVQELRLEPAPNGRGLRLRTKSGP